MPYRIGVSRFSLIQFAESDSITACNWTTTDMCLPVFSPDDVWFQIYVDSDTEAEADALCSDIDMISYGLVERCTDGYLLQFAQKPKRYRISTTRVLYVWDHGVPGFEAVLSVGDCFHFRIDVDISSYCSNCFQRIGDDCHTSVIQFGNDDNAFGYLYCAGANDDSNGGGGSGTDCEPLEIPFFNVPSMTIPWTAFLNDRYGPLPSIEVWVYDQVTNELIKPGLVAELDTYPPTQIFIDMGGPSSGIVKIM